MLKLLGQRIAIGLVTLIVVSVLIFTITEWLPRDLPAHILGPLATAESIGEVSAKLELNRPAPERYIEWLRGAIDGDFGTSLATGRPVADMIGPRLRSTLFLALYAAVVAVPIAIFLGFLAAIHRNSLIDRLMGIVSITAISTPEFLVGYVLILYLAVQSRWFPAIATFKPEQTIVQHLHATFLPMMTLALVVIAHMMRKIRSALLTVMASPYIEMALLKGIPSWRIVLRHALPNVRAHLIKVIGLNLAYLIVGVVVVESVFTYNGLGRLMVDAVARRDVPLVQACGLIFAVVFIGLNLIAEVLSIFGSPRLRHPR